MPIVVCSESGICEILAESVVMPVQHHVESFLKLVLELLKDERHAITEGLMVRDILNGHESSYHFEKSRDNCRITRPDFTQVNNSRIVISVIIISIL